MSISPGIISIGGTSYTLQLWKGQILPMQDIADIYARMGQQGSGVQILGKVAVPSAINAFYFTTTRTDGITMRNNIMSLQGQFPDITEPDSGTWSKALIKTAIGRVTNGFYTINGTSFPVLVSFQIVIEAQQ